VNFSIILNSRERPQLLTLMLESVQNTTEDLDNIEVIVNFDTDDCISLNILDMLHSKFPFLKSTIFKREHNIHTNVNRLADLATGKYIWALGDDCHILTKNWDVIAKNKFEEYFDSHPDRVALGAVESTSVDKSINTPLGWYSDAPIFSKECRDILGYLIHPHFISLGADVATYTIYKAVDRIIDMKEIVFDHILHNTVQKVITPDKTAYEYRQRQAHFQSLNPFEYDYSQEIKMLKDKLNEQIISNI